METNFIKLPRGTYLMGSGDNSFHEKEKPLHEVTIDYDVALCKTQVTVEEYMLYAEATAVEVPTDKHEHLGVDVPVRRVRWTDAKNYCLWKSEREGVTYRLPTEAEWEYACRAGSHSKFCFGDDITLLGDYAWYKENSNGVTHNVASKKANAWGFYDMHGNVWEWCLDNYSENYEGVPCDGSAYKVVSQKGMVLRGGAWSGQAENNRSASRINLGATSRNYFVGFRVLIEL